MHIKDLCPEIVLHRSTGKNQDFLILELGAQDVLFGYLDSSASLAHSRSMEEQHVAFRAIGTQDTANQELKCLEMKLFRRTLVFPHRF
jgi:hypothetical protein